MFQRQDGPLQGPGPGGVDGPFVDRVTGQGNQPLSRSNIFIVRYRVR